MNAISALKPSARVPARPLDIATGNWFAGLVDGEGCFSIGQYLSHGFIHYACAFTIRLRSDDLPVLEMLRDRLAIGRISHNHKRGPGLAKPVSSWTVSDKRGCLRLTEVMDTFPLRSKKARDYAIWREAAIYLASCNRPIDWAPVAAWRDELRLVRQYLSPFTAREARRDR